MSYRSAFLLITAAALAACQGGAETGAPPTDAPAPAPVVADTPQAERAWLAQRAASYDYELTIACMCIHRGTYEVQVREGKLAAVHLPGGAPAPEARVEWILTVDDLFRAMRQASSLGTPVRAEYHPQLGYPMEAEIGRLADDSGTLYRIEKLVVR